MHAGERGKGGGSDGGMETSDPEMSSIRTITLFSERPAPSRKGAPLLYSIIFHIVAIPVISIGILYPPNIDDRIKPKRYTVRHLDLHTPKSKDRESAGKGISYPGPDSKERKPVAGEQPAQEQAVLRLTADAPKGAQTLVQPDLPEPVKVPEVTPVPTVVIWSPKTDQVKKIVAPLPEQATAADVKPSPIAPNQEINLGDLSVSLSNTPTSVVPVFPTTTSPLVIHGPKVVQMAPVTASQTAHQPTPTAVMSISDLRMPEGTATLPPVNQTTDKSESGLFSPGKTSAGHAQGSVGGEGKDGGSGKSGEPSTVAGLQSGTKPGSGAGSGDDSGLTTAHFVLPKDGEFGAVIVGASLEEKFPEMAGIWNNRVAYTVYLHVGLSKSWILQYSLPRADEAAAGGNMTRLEAPWPFNIVRPNIPSAAFNSDAILVHGFVNQSGRFESLKLAFPPEFQQARFVLDALMQWEFRPAARNGQTQKVEVLLIIPEEPEPALDPTTN